MINQLRSSIDSGNLRVIAVLPTGGGKTFTFCHIIKLAIDRGRKCLILTDRIELLRQAGGVLSQFQLTPIEVKAGTRPYLGGVLYTAMVETLARRIDQKDYQYWLKSMDLIIIDECHMRSFDKVFPFFRRDSRVIGFTATPNRMGNEAQLVEFYDDICVGVEIQYLVENGFLSKPIYYAVESDLSGIRTVQGEYDQNDVAKRYSERKLYRGVVDNWNKHARGTKTLVFCANIASSKELIDEFASHGITARHMDSKMKKSDRSEVLRWFHSNPKAVLCNVGILTKGFDEPSIETVILYRPTTSIALYLQMVGRGSRIHKPTGKTEFKVLDFGDNIRRLGYWHRVREWSLETKNKQRNKKDAAALKKCERCEAFIPAQQVTCNFCGHVHVKLQKEMEYAELKQLDPAMVWRQSRNLSLKEQAEMAKQKLIKPFRVLHNVKSLEEAEEFVRHMGYSKGWFHYNHHRFWWSEAYQEKRDTGEVIIKAS